MENYVVAWNESVVDKSKLDTCKLIKSDKWETAKHISSNLSKHKRSLVSRLRLGVLSIGIETGRFEYVIREQRICKLCNNGNEDECHFLFDCESTKRIRLAMYHKEPELLNLCNNPDKFKVFCKKPHRFGNYVHDLWNERNTLLNSV